MNNFKITSLEQYKIACKKAAENPDKFWAEIAKNFYWQKDFEQVCEYDFKKPLVKWFKGGQTNIVYNCLDRHIKNGKGSDVAFICEPNEINESAQKISYQQLFEQVCQFANLLEAQGVKKGDRVCIYMPMILEGVVAMLACARIGAVHSIVFAGFSAKALAGRIQDSQAKILITAEVLNRGDKTIKLYDIACEAVEECDSIEKIIVYSQEKIEHEKYEIINWQSEVKKYDKNHECVFVESNDPLFILYTSGSTGKPKGVVHTHGGYMVYAGYSFQNVFGYENGDVFFCSADIGWITGHSYLVYGPLLQKATSIIFEGTPFYPTPSRFWQIIQKHKVNIFYTAPTAIRALMQKGDKFAEGFDLTSLKTLGSVGEPINLEAWNWYNEKIGAKKCAIADTWWQTETGGILITSLAHVIKSKATFAGLPLPGVEPMLLNEEGQEIQEPNKAGNLVFKKPWPSLFQGVFGDDKKYLENYFKQFEGFYLAGDGAYKDEEGFFRIIGRVDDVIKISGHRLGSAEIENAINLHEDVAESAVIGFPHEIKGEGICVFVIKKKIVKLSDEELHDEIMRLIVNEIGSIARPEKIYIVDDLPKTRSGKIMRRILKKIVNHESDLGDISTLLDPTIVEKVKKLVA